MTQTLFSKLKLFDGCNDAIQDDSWILVDDQTGKIVTVGQDINTAPTATNQVSLNNQYVMPGLINAHTHMVMDPLTSDGATGDNVVAATVRAVQNLHTLLKSGVTYIRECGSSYDIDIVLAQLVAENKINNAPDIMPSGRPFSMTGGHGDMPNFGHLVDSPDEMRKAVRQGLKKGAQSIKVMATGGVMTPNDFMDDPQLSETEINVAVTEAHHKNRIVAAHAEGNPGILNAIKAGVDSIEHGFYVNDEEIDLMLKQNTFLTPTIVADWAIANYGPGKIPDWEVAKAQAALDDLKRNIYHAHQRGVAITLGTDAGTPFNTFAMTAVELQLLVELGFSNFEALQTSQNSAKLMQIADEYGTLESGKYADFLVIGRNPLQDITAVQQNDKKVFKKGQQMY
ncbi:metal-dependent hydrolase family protein [Bombilactobacillus thymidiniphilus]|uniref:Amidohydrolase family protein n=1 Tax=Bombilactobacillus thymidiniphilus TaxID=2923363 RepID=A0ABY4PDS3_9LACO|nr:amidohydrolase family protein [Bombilactobacillus thymidiniphilus]UQS83923.1 amidohydrolase family protein [Bombilactobacillus thymidiniphilus]